MKADKLTLERVFDRTERLEAPLFQRPYVWKEDENWIPLWEAIETIAQKKLEDKPTRPHFLGTIVLDQLKTQIGTIHARQIIEGQQRLTTLQILLAAVRDLSAQYNQPKYADTFRKLTDNHFPLSNDPNDWAREHNQPRYILDLLKRVVRVSIETMKIVNTPPALNERTAG
jgi:uncharacterized protein with ParB-like and HNH nuclease domain